MTPPPDGQHPGFRCKDLSEKLLSKIPIGFTFLHYGFLGPWATTLNDGADVLCIINGEWKTTAWSRGGHIGFWALRDGSPIAIANGHGKKVDGNPSQDSPTLIKAYVVEPAGSCGIDALYFLDHDEMRWSDIMSQVEYSLEQQMADGDKERPWDEMIVTIKGVLLTPEQWEEISGNEY